MMINHNVVDWMIETEISGEKLKCIVYRKDADFYLLRQVLL